MNEYEAYVEQVKMQDYLQKSASEEQSKMYAPQLKEQLNEAQAAVIAQTNPSKALKVILASWKGRLLDEQGEIIMQNEPMMNQHGIAKLSSMLSPFLSDPTRFGNIRELESKKFALKATNDITKVIGFNWREFGIKGENRDIIVTQCLTLIRITLSRSEEQGEKNWLGRVVLESVSGNKMPTKKKESWYDKYVKL